MMRLPRIFFFVFTLLMFFVAPVGGADFQKGLKAFESYNYDTAYKHLKQYAEQGQARAQYALGQIYWTGTDKIPKNYTLAYKWWMLATKQNHPGATFSIGVIYNTGSGLPRDETKAFQWFKKSADLGEKYAYETLGDFYREGIVVRRNYKLAYRYYKKAALLGVTWAMYRSGLMAKKLAHLPVISSSAKRWFSMAADQGDRDAMFELGVVHAEGIGTLQNFVTAHMWLNITSSFGNVKARTYRDKIAKKMTPAQIAEAQKLARECVKKKYKGC
jgi:uncharacterized protein